MSVVGKNRLLSRVPRRTLLLLINVLSAYLRAKEFQVAHFALGDNSGSVRLFVIDASTQSSPPIGPSCPNEFVDLEKIRSVVLD